MVGAVLTQNTSWTNVTKALEQIKAAGMMNYQSLLNVPHKLLAELIKPSGYYNLKAERLKNLLQMIENSYEGSLELLFADEPWAARDNLLQVKGVGPETADSILLYGGKHSVFVVDAYTHRVFSRHGLVPAECDYNELQELFMDNLKADHQLFNEYHALIVKVAKSYCKKAKPNCQECPLGVLQE